MKIILITLLAWPLLISAKYTDSFIVTVKDRTISVSSPEKRLEVVSVIIENETLDKIISQLKTDKKVIKRFVLNPQSKEVYQVDMRSVEKLFFIPIAPPFQSVELKFKQGLYEIPEKK